MKRKIKKVVSIIIVLTIALSFLMGYLEDNNLVNVDEDSPISTLTELPLKLYRKVTNIITPTESNRIRHAAKTLYQEVFNAVVYNDNFYEKGIVKRVIDGDTLVVVVNGVEEKIRLIGVNTPESVGKYLDNPQYYGKEASRYTKANLLGKHVYLEADRGPTDRFGRQLRYVWLKNPDEGSIKEDCFNAILIQEGYGEVMIISPNSKYADIFRSFEKIAKLDKRGLWSK